MRRREYEEVWNGQADKKHTHLFSVAAFFCPFSALRVIWISTD